MVGLDLGYNNIGDGGAALLGSLLQVIRTVLQSVQVFRLLEGISISVFSNLFEPQHIFHIGKNHVAHH